ncbi:MAG: hypothetical protein U0491_00960 [Candidatus Saccharimonadales bacterium]
MPNAVYDDEKERTANPDSSLVNDSNETAQTASDSSSDTNLADKESDAAKNDTFDEPPTAEKSFYNPMGDKQNSLKSSSTSIVSNIARRRVILGALIPIGLILIVLFLMSALKIPNYAANIATYRFARSAMEYAKTSSEIDGAKIAIETSDDTKYGKFREKYANLRSATWGKFDQYRPEKVYQNLKADGTIKYEVETKKWKGIETRTKITAVIINNERIPVESQTFRQRFGSPVDSYRDRLKYSRAVNAQISEALKGSSTLVRSSVAKKIRADLNIKLRFWEKGAKNYSGLKPDEADQLLLKENDERIRTKPTGTATTSSINEATDKVDNAIKDCIDDADCAKEMASGENPEKITTALTESADEGIVRKALGIISPTYGIVVPACMIYDGSIDHASDAIDAQTASTIKTYNTFATQADQQKVGDTSPEAIAAVNRKLAAGDSVPDQYLSGRTVDTSVEKSPQASVLGDFTMLNALIPNQTVANGLNTIAEPVCKTLTNVGVNAAIAGVSIVIAIFTGGTSGAAEGAGSQSIRAIVTATLEKGFLKTIVKSAVDKVATIEGRNQLKGFSKKFARDFVAIEGATALTKLLVMSRSGLINNGATSSGADYINQADMGAVNENNIYMQQMMYGAPMTNANTALADKSATTLLAEKESQAPGLGKYFGITSPVSKIRNNMAIGFASMKQRGLSSSLKYFSFGSVLKSIIPNQNVSAADTSGANWGIVQWGWTDEENALIARDSSYGVVENEAALSDQVRSVVESEYGKCFSSTMGTLLGSGDIKRNESGDVVTNDGLCSPENLGPKNPKYGDAVFRWRLSKKREMVLDQNLGLQNPSKDGKSDSGGTVGGGGSSGGQGMSADEVFAQCKNNTATGKVKIVCGTTELNGVPYGENFVSAWKDAKPSPLGCNSYANIAIARATNGKYRKDYCSGGYEKEGAREGNFKKIAKTAVQPGDLIIHDRLGGASCGGTSGEGHVEVVVSYDPKTDKLITTGAHSSRTPSGVTDPVNLKNSDYWDYGVEYVGGGL